MTDRRADEVFDLSSAAELLEISPADLRRLVDNEFFVAEDELPLDADRLSFEDLLVIDPGVVLLRAANCVVNSGDSVADDTLWMRRVGAAVRTALRMSEPAVVIDDEISAVSGSGSAELAAKQRAGLARLVLSVESRRQTLRRRVDRQWRLKLIRHLEESISPQLAAAAATLSEAEENLRARPPVSSAASLTERDAVAQDDEAVVLAVRSARLAIDRLLGELDELRLSLRG
jgi:hypothetical protein